MPFYRMPINGTPNRMRGSTQSGTSGTTKTGYETETIDLLARFGGTYDDPRKDAIDVFITALKDQGLWSTIDVMQIYAAKTSADGYLNWIANANNATGVNSPTFTVDRGFATDGSSSYIDTNFNPAAHGVKYTQNSATFGIYTRSNTSVNGIDGGATIGTCYTAINIRQASGNAFYTINNDGSGYNTAVSVSNSQGLTAAIRTSSSDRYLGKNGSYAQNETYTSNGVPNGDFYIGCRNDEGSPGNYSAREYSVFVVASGWTETQLGNFYSNLQTYLTYIGANV